MVFNILPNGWKLFNVACLKSSAPAASIALEMSFEMPSYHLIKDQCYRSGYLQQKGLKSNAAAILCKLRIRRSR
jgi:hypothetical protein